MLIATKLRPPGGGAQWITREHVLADVAARHEARRCRACVIAATGGFGKTTLAAQWGERLARAGDAVSWLSLDADDDNPERLCEYLLVALHRAQPAVDSDLASLLADGATDAPSRVLAAAINAIASTKKRATVILDDCHCITDPRARELLRFLVARSPDNLHFILTLRPPAPFPLGALRAHDELTEVDARALRFDADEADALLNQSGQPLLDAAAIRELWDRTEGWPAALRLVSISLRGAAHRKADEVIAGLARANRAVADYLAENILDRLDAQWARFLVKTSVLDRLCADVCDAVTGETGSQKLLDRTEEAGLFLVALDAERRWFRYHQVFVEFLRRRLAASPDLSARDLHLAASEWFANQGLIEEAVGHARSASDADRAVELVERDAMLLVEQSRMSLLLALVDKLSPSVVADRPGLQVAIAWARCLLHLPGETGAMLDAFAPSDPAQAAELDLIRSVHVGFELDDPERIAPLLERAMPHLRTEPWLLGVAANVRAFAELRRGRLTAARGAVTRGRPHQDRARGSFSAVYGRCIEGLAQQELGDLDGAEKSFERALDVAVRDVGRHGYATRMASAFLGAIRYERDDLAGANKLLESAFSVRESGIPDIPIAIYVARIRLHEVRGDHDAALAELYECARQAASRRLERLAAAVMHEQVRIHLAAGDVDLAARRCDAPSGPRPPDAHRQQAWELGVLARARVAIARGHATSALPLLVDLRDRAQAEGRRRFELSVRVVTALAIQAAGDGTAARPEIAAALVLGEEQGAVRTLADEGQALHLLLRRLPASRYVGRVLGAARSAGTVEIAPPLGGTGSATPVTGAWPSLIEPLNVRELQILRLIEEGMVNKDVSATLGIGLDTVKWHLKNAYKKLGVATRTGAIHAARSAGVLGTTGPRPRLASG